MAYSEQSIIIISVVLPLIAVVAVVLRFIVRIKIQPTYIGVDDWLAVFSVLLVLVNGAVMIIGVVAGTQTRVYEGKIPPERYVVQAKVDYATTIFEKPLFGGMKLCALFFFRRIFVKRTFRIVSETMIVIITAWVFSFMIAYVFSCGTNFYIWFTPSAPRTPPKCVNINLLALLFSVTDTVGDAAMVTMPFFPIRKLRLPRRQKLAVIAIFMLGTLSTAASIVRLVFLAQAYTKSFGSGGNNKGSGIAPAVWSLVEGAVGVLAACLPPLGPLIRKGHVLRRLSSSARGTTPPSRKQSLPKSGAKEQLAEAPSAETAPPLPRLQDSGLN